MKMSRRNRSEPDYHDIAGMDTLVHRPTGQDVFINEVCGYDEDLNSFEECEKSDRPDIGELAAQEYAKAHGYEVHPVEIDNHRPGVDVVGFDPETREVVLIEAKTKDSSDRFVKSDLSKTNQKGGGVLQYDPAWIRADNRNKVRRALSKAPDEETEFKANNNYELLEAIDQTYGEAVGYRKEFVGVQVGETENDPVSETLADVFERAYVVQLPASTGEQESQLDDVVAEDPFGVNNAEFKLNNISEREEINVSEDAEKTADHWSDQIGENQAYAAAPPEFQGETDPPGWPDRDDPVHSELMEAEQIGPERVDNLEEQDIVDFEDVNQSEEGELSDADGIGNILAERLRDEAEEEKTSQQAADGDTSTESSSSGDDSDTDEDSESGDETDSSGGEEHQSDTDTDKSWDAGESDRLSDDDDNSYGI